MFNADYIILTDGMTVAVADHRVAVAVGIAVPSAGYEVLEGVQGVLLQVVHRLLRQLFLRLREDFVSSGLEAAVDALLDIVPSAGSCEMEKR